MTAASSAQPPGEAARRLVVAVGPAAERAAAADPRSAGRDTVAVGRWPDVPGALSGAGGGSTLIVTPAADLTYRALGAYAEASVATGTPIGVLPVGADGRLLGAGRRPAPPAPAAGALYCHFRPAFACDAEFGRDEVETFLDRLTGGVEAAVLHTHGNGADLQLGEHVVCVQVDHLRGRPEPGDLTLPCQAGGPCRLAHLPLTAYWGASAVRARIVVLISCWGYLPADGLLSAEALLGTALFRGPNVEAFIATTRVTYNTPELAQAALAFLEMGGTAGELTLLLNRFPGTASPPYVCVGDPEARVLRADGRATRHDCAAGAPAAAGRAAAPEGMSFARLASLEESVRHAGLPAEARAEIMAAFGPVLKEGRRAHLSTETERAVAAATRRTPRRPAGAAPAEPAPADPAAADRPAAGASAGAAIGADTTPVRTAPARTGADAAGTDLTGADAEDAIAHGAASGGAGAVRRPGPGRRFRALTALAARHTGDLPPEEAEAFWQLAHGGTPDDAVDREWCRVQTMLLRRRGPDQLGYLSSVSVYRDERLDRDLGPAYHLCGKRMFRITVEFTALDGYARDLCHCERCGLIADLPPGIPAPFLVGRDGGLLVEAAPWPRAWMTGGIVPVGPSLVPASAPRQVDLSEPLPLPGAASGRRHGVVLVHGGDHLIIQTPLPPFSSLGAPGGAPAERTNVWRTVS